MNSIEEQILERATYKLDMDKKIIQAGMFNNEATDNDRKSFLTYLLSSSNGDEQAEKVPSLKQINELVARDDEELKIFNEMDKEMEAERKSNWQKLGNRGAPPPMLMEDKEVPSYLFETKERNEKEEVVSSRMSAREVRYNDQMSEREFEKMVESGLGKEEWLRQRDEKRKKRDAKLAKRAEKMAKMEKEKILENIQNIYDVIVGETDESGRNRSLLFMKKPSRKKYADYYQIIQNPIDLSTIQKRIESEFYNSGPSFKKDFLLLFSNAMTYNDSECQVYDDAVELQVGLLSTFLLLYFSRYLFNRNSF
jgi:hypothetical protein